MLDLRPSCEHCDCDLPPNATNAMICTFECTFCAQCVEDILHNVCPNCGGGFEKRPVRPFHQWREGISLQQAPPSTERVHHPVDTDEHDSFAESIRPIPPKDR